MKRVMDVLIKNIADKKIVGCAGGSILMKRILPTLRLFTLRI